MDCPSEHVKNQDLIDFPPSYEQATFKHFVDPTEIITKLKTMGCRVSSCKGLVLYMSILTLDIRAIFIEKFYF